MASISSADISLVIRRTRPCGNGQDGAADARGQEIGRLNTNTAPSFDAPSRRRSAFIFFARRYESARPRPRPGALLAASWTLLENALKRRALLMASRPGPWSATRISILSLTRSTPNLIARSLASAAYLQALSTRLNRICSTDNALARMAASRAAGE